MSETPKQTKRDAPKEPVQFEQILIEFIDDPRTPPQREADEASLKTAARQIDAEHGARDARETRQDVIERRQAGEDISPETVAYTGEILLAAEMEVQSARQQPELPFDEPSS